MKTKYSEIERLLIAVEYSMSIGDKDQADYLFSLAVNMEDGLPKA